jgi:MFS family permease
VTEKSSSDGAKGILLMLAAGQFLMVLDSSVMNVSIAYVADDVGTTISGIQTAITLYTLVMAAFMIPGGKVGAIIGHKRAFLIGLVVYASGSFVTSMAGSLPVLIFGWSFLEGLGAALIMPAIVALVAGNFSPERRASAYGTIAAAGAVAVAVGPLIGGFITTFFTWRWVFGGEVILVAIILLGSRSLKDSPVADPPKFDLLGAILTVLGLSLIVYGVLKSGDWGWVLPRPDGPDVLGTSPVIWLIIGGMLVLFCFWLWAKRLENRGQEPLIRPSMLHNGQLNGGLLMFFFQFLVQNSAFFVVPLFLSVVLEMSAVATGIRLLPLSIALVIAAAAIPRVFPNAAPRTIVRLGLLSLLVGTLSFVAGVDPGAGPEIVTVPMLLLGAGIGALASQLGAVTVSAVPDEQSAEVGGLQNTMTNFGASMGTALVGSVLFSTLTAAFTIGVLKDPAIPDVTKEQARTNLSRPIPFISDSQLRSALETTGASEEMTTAVTAHYADARYVSLRLAMSLVALFAVIALFFTGLIPREPPRSEGSTERAGAH